MSEGKQSRDILIAKLLTLQGQKNLANKAIAKANEKITKIEQGINAVIEELKAL